MKAYESKELTRVHPGLGALLTEFGKKLGPYGEFLKSLRREPASLTEIEQDVAKSQLGLIDSVLGQLGEIRASLIAGGLPQLRDEDLPSEHHEAGC